MIGDKILEVNVLNPGGITNINKLDKLKLHRQVVELEYLLKRLSDLRE